MLTISTESQAGKKKRRKILSHAGVIALFFILNPLVFFLDALMRRHFQADKIGFLAVVPIGLAAIAFLYFFSDARGKWKFDAEGITFTPRKGNARTLKWNDLAAVRVYGGTIEFRGSVKIPKLPLDCAENEEQRNNVLLVIRSRTENSFAQGRNKWLRRCPGSSPFAQQSS
jgi:hypothetical protein